MWAIFKQTIKDRKMSLLIYCLFAIFFLWMYVAMFPSIRDKSAEMTKLLEAYPKSFMDAFGLKMEELSFTKLESFLAMEQFSFVWPIMMIALMVSLGGSAIAGEIEKGTIETLLSQPISRLKIFFAKYLAGVFNLVVFTIVSIFAVIPMAAAYNIDIQRTNYLTIAVLSLAFGLAILSIASLMSAIFSEKGRAYFLVVGLIVLMYVAKIVANLKESLSDLKYFSFFYYYDSSAALIHNSLDKWAIWVFLAVAVVGLAAGAVWFWRRDISVS